MPDLLFDNNKIKKKVTQTNKLFFSNLRLVIWIKKNANNTISKLFSISHSGLSIDNIIRSNK